MANQKGQLPSGVGEVNLIKDFRQALAPERVGIVEFAESDQYCNKRLYPYQRVLLKTIFLEELTGWEEDLLTKWIKSSSHGGEVTMAPMVRERVEYLRENNYPHFEIVQLVGGRRGGKGYMTGIAIAYKVWNLVLMDDPMVYYGVDPDKEIYFPIVAVKQDQAKKFQYADAYNTLLGCKALHKYWGSGGETEVSIHTPADLRKATEARARGQHDTRDMAKIKVAAEASASDTLRGATSMVLTLDEFAHFIEGESRRSGTQVWEGATPSMKQFDKDYMIFANSSPWTKIGMFFELYEQSLEMEGAFPAYPSHFMVQYPSWAIYKDYDKDEQGRFKRALITFEGLADERRKNPDGFRVEWGAQFAEVIDAFLRPEAVDRAFTGQLPDGRIIFTNHAGVAGFVYKGHGDPSSTTANFGIGIGHVEWFEEQKLDDEGKPMVGPDGQPVMIQMPHVVFDLLDAFYPEDMVDEQGEPTGVIDWVNVVMPEIKRLIRNFRPKEFTFDQFDSTHAIQLLRKEIAEMGIHDVRVKEKTATKSVNKRRWDNFKAALYLGRVHAPSPRGQTNQRSLELVRDELKFLQEKNGTVVKQDIGPIQTKDIADCMAEVVDYLIGDQLTGIKDDLGSARVQAGAEGGYKIGGHRGKGAFDAFYGEKGKRDVPNPARGRTDPRQRRRLR